MLLAIDSGNTNIVFAVFGEDGKLCGQWRAVTAQTLDADACADWLLTELAGNGISASDITGAIIATVVPSNLNTLVQVCVAHFGQTPLVVGAANVDLGIEALTDNPTEVGADRLVNAVAAGDAYSSSLICLDFGTATTFDVIDGDGNYTGGIIAPGINLSLQALYAAAAKLPEVSVAQPTKVIGTNTIDAMQSGIFWGYVSMIEGLVKRIQDEYGAPMKVIATGGLSPLFSKATPLIEATDVDLTLRGLYLIYLRNRS